MRLREGCVAVVLGLCSWARAAAQVVVPNVYQNAEGPGSTPVPIHIQGQPWTFQLILHESQLTSLVGREITAISYRRSATEGGGYPLQTTSWNPYVIRLGQSVTPSAATGTFATNFTESPTQVRAGSWTVPTLAWPNNGPPGPNPWGPEIAFDTPYLYTGGHLAMLITHQGSDNSNPGNALLDSTGSSTPGLGTDISYFAATGFDVASGSSSNFMPVVQFTSVVPVPEPATCLLTAAIALGLVAAFRRKRNVGPGQLDPGIMPLFQRCPAEPTVRFLADRT